KYHKMDVTILIFIVGYLLIVFEHTIKIDKAAIALITGILMWVTLTLNWGYDAVEHPLKEHFEEIAEIVFFLLGAMTIVELIDTHNGFSIVNKIIKTHNKRTLLWIISVIAFFFSAVLDNLTTTIVIIAILKKFISDKNDIWFFAGFVVIAANAGGAWSPIGDITTIMLWNGEQVTGPAVIRDVFLPSMVCLLVPLIIASFFIKGRLTIPEIKDQDAVKAISAGESTFILVLGVFALLLVPVFKHFTHLPPFIGMLFSLSILWLTTEIIHRKKATDVKHHFSVASTIQRIDTPSILFFLGILLAVAVLQVNGNLMLLGEYIDSSTSSFYVTNILLGLFSSIIDNVPLVAGAMGMYSMERYPQDHEFWTLLAYCAGTGGSALIIGSAAGVAAMGILKIDFIWYLKRITWLALVGYFSGVLVFILFK